MLEKKLLVLNVVGLTRELITKETSPFLYSFLKNAQQSYLNPPIPAVTCTSQTEILTGKSANEHGIVANGWYFKERSEVKLWQQSNHLVKRKKIWDELKEINPKFSVTNMFWWYNMYSTADYSVTPRPIYRADGAKYPDTYTQPEEFNDYLKKKLGTFPLFNFWGPKTNIKSSQWIANATVEAIEHYKSNLVFCYLPHLDYNLQRWGTKNKRILKDMLEIDEVVKNLVSEARKKGYNTIILSEYGIQDVDTPIHINKILREHHYLATKIECGEEHFDAGASEAFAVADHQLAHIYVKNHDNIKKIIQLLQKNKNIEEILTRDESKKYNLNHERSGDIICLAKKNSWFTYYYWLDEKKAPDYAKTVDIHRKPGYDPVELFAHKNAFFKVIKSLIKKKLGFRYLMNVIPLDASLVKGSHGVQVGDDKKGPLLLADFSFTNKKEKIHMWEVYHIIKKFFL